MNGTRHSSPLRSDKEQASKQAGRKQVAQAANIIRETSRSRLRAQPLRSREREEKLHQLATRDCGTLERPGTCSEASCWKLHVQYIICDNVTVHVCDARLYLSSNNLQGKIQPTGIVTCNPTDGTGQAGKKRMTLVQNVQMGIETQRILGEVGLSDTSIGRVSRTHVAHKPRIHAVPHHELKTPCNSVSVLLTPPKINMQDAELPTALSVLP